MQGDQCDSMMVQNKLKTKDGPYAAQPSHGNALVGLLSNTRKDLDQDLQDLVKALEALITTYVSRRHQFLGNTA